jgi:hypothetical protein
MNVLVKSAWGSYYPAKAAFPFLHANALVEAGHAVQVFLLGEAVSLMRDPVARAVIPLGWPPLAEMLEHTDPCLRSLLKGPWGPRPRPGWKECQLCQSGYPGPAHRMGG